MFRLVAKGGAGSGFVDFPDLINHSATMRFCRNPSHASMMYNFDTSMTKIWERINFHVRRVMAENVSA